MFSIQHKQTIIRVFVCLEVLSILTLIFGAIFAFRFETVFPVLYVIGSKLGTAAAILLVVVLLPGIVGRFRWFTMVRIILLLFRRHLGILMYLFAVVHAAFVLQLPMARYGVYPLQIFEVFGFIASSLLFPLYITSNDVAVKLLKVWWSRLHKLIYVSLFFAALHTWNASKFVGGLLFIVVVLEVGSYIAKYRYDHSASR